MTYVSCLNGKFDILAENGGSNVVLVLAVVEEDFAHDVGSLDEAVTFLQ